MIKMTRRAVLLGTGAVLGAYGMRAYYDDPIPVGRTLGTPDAPMVLNDASELSATPVAKHSVISERIALDQVTQLRAEMQEAKTAQRSLLASGTRHSMGAHSIARAGTTLSMAQTWVEVDRAKQTYRCGAGTRWADVIAALEPLGFSPAVVQSHHDFTVAGSYSVNGHGMAVPFAGCGATVEALEMVLADGTQLSASRDENADIFTVAMGGYGLFGIVTELEMKMVPNTRLEPLYQDVNPVELGVRMAAAIKDGSGVQMACGHLDVARDSFLERSVLRTYRPAANQSDVPSLERDYGASNRARRLFRSQVGSDRMKNTHWWYGAQQRRWSLAGAVSRNTLLNTPVSSWADMDDTRVDILQEYFVSPASFGALVSTCRDVISSSYQELLRVDVRYMLADTESWLSYAPGERICLSLMFSQEKSVRAEADMRRMTEVLIDRCLDLGGTYYLPFRPHARQDQFARAYPGLRAFVAKKRAMDPENLFRNGLWDRYMARL